jgi:hypothetical protein
MELERPSESQPHGVGGARREPLPGGSLPGELPSMPDREPDQPPDQGPTGPRAPYPVDDPGISDPRAPGSEPDYLPGGPTNPNTRY